MTREFNTSHWRDNLVTKREQVPSAPHFQALVFGSRNECYESYGPPDPPGNTYYSVPTVDLYVFTCQEVLNLFVSEIVGTDKQYVFYATGPAGKATVKVDVGITFPQETTRYRDGYDPDEGNRG